MSKRSDWNAVKEQLKNSGEDPAEIKRRVLVAIDFIEQQLDSAEKITGAEPCCPTCTQNFTAATFAQSNKEIFQAALSELAVQHVFGMSVLLSLVDNDDLARNLAPELVEDVIRTARNISNTRGLTGVPHAATVIYNAFVSNAAVAAFNSKGEANVETKNERAESAQGREEIEGVGRYRIVFEEDGSKRAELDGEVVAQWDRYGNRLYVVGPGSDTEN